MAFPKTVAVPGSSTSRRSFVTRAGALFGVGSLLAACGGAGGAGDKIAQNKTSRQVTLRWSTWGDDKNSFNTDAAPKGMKLFQERNPNVKVTIEPQIDTPGGAAWWQKNQTEWVAGTGPDMSGHCCVYGISWAQDGLLVNMEPMMKKDIPAKIREDFVEWLMKLFTSPQAGLWALPMYSGTIGLYYNKTMFQRKGVPLPDDTWDWNKYREAAVKLNDPNAGQFGRRQVRGLDRVIQKIHQAGGNWVDPSSNTKAVFDSAAAMQALQYERDANLKDKYTVREGVNPLEYNATQGMDLYKAISAQKFAMWEEGSWILTRQVLQVEKDVVPQWDVAPLPKGPKQRDTLATHDGWGIWKGSKNIDESWELVKFLQSDEWVDINSRISGQQPARKSMQDRWAKGLKEAYPQLADKNLKPFQEAIAQNYARPKEFFKKANDSEQIMNTFLNEALYGTELNPAIKNGEKSLDAAVKDTISRLNDLNK
jgi:multiple sugar transport system substrate-binding protein